MEMKVVVHLVEKIVFFCSNFVAIVITFLRSSLDISSFQSSYSSNANGYSER